MNTNLKSIYHKVDLCVVGVVVDRRVVSCRDVLFIGFDDLLVLAGVVR